MVMLMKTQKNIRTQFYKYEYVPWTQPVLSSNGVMGGNAFAVSAVNEHAVNSGYKAFFCVASDANSSEQRTWQSGSIPSSYTFYNPIPIKVSNIQITNRISYPRAISTGAVYGSNDAKSWVKLSTFKNTNNTASATWSINLSNNTNAFKYYKLGDLTNLDTSNALLGIGKLTITATQQKNVPATSDDYDYYVQEPVYRSPVYTLKTYYKYEYQDWVQPILFENGVVGQSAFAVTSNITPYADSKFYHLFDNNTGTAFHTVSGVTTGYIDLYSADALKITNILVNNQNATKAGSRASSAGKIYGRNNDTEEWMLISSYTNTVQDINAQWNINLSTNTNYYKYYRIESTANGGATYWTIASFAITATAKVLSKGTISDYDFYKYEQIYHAIKE